MPSSLERSGPTAVESRTQPLGVGILGCGHVSDQYFEGCSEWDCLRLVACADLDQARAAQKAEQHGVPKVCSPDELLEDPDVDIVINLTPPLSHARATLGAIRAGKHVWSEKPLAPSLEEARELLGAAQDRGMRLGCAPDTFLGGALQTSIKLVGDGWLGAPVAAVAFVSEHGYEHFHPNVDFFYGPGGGPALDLGPYYVTALVALLGSVARVTGLARASFTERLVPSGPRRGERIPVRVPTHVTGALEFESGALATILMSWDIWSTQLPFLEIYGSEGSLSVPDPDRFDGRPRLRRASREELQQQPPEPGSLPWTPIPLIHRGDVGRGIGVAEMAHAINANRPHRASAELAYHVLEVLSALQRSEHERRHVEIESRCEPPAPLPSPPGNLGG